MFTKDFFIFFLFFFRYYFVGRNICGFITFRTFWNLKLAWNYEIWLCEWTCYVSEDIWLCSLTLSSFKSWMDHFVRKKYFGLKRIRHSSLNSTISKATSYFWRKTNQQNKSILHICLSTRTVQTIYLIKCVMSTNVL
jgi:hypothetical protein